MCSHKWLKVNDLDVCTKCGVTRLFNGKILFDKALTRYIKKSEGRHGKKKKRTIS